MTPLPRVPDDERRDLAGRFLPPDGLRRVPRVPAGVGGEEAVMGGPDAR